MWGQRIWVLSQEEAMMMAVMVEDGEKDKDKGNGSCYQWMNVCDQRIITRNFHFKMISLQRVHVKEVNRESRHVIMRVICKEASVNPDKTNCGKHRKHARAKDVKLKGTEVCCQPFWVYFVVCKDNLSAVTTCLKIKGAIPYVYGSSGRRISNC